MKAAPVLRMRRGQGLSLAPLLIRQLGLGPPNERGELADGRLELRPRFVHARNEIAVLIVG